ncbi:hypothetical protein HNP86_001861 [Methanococcus maripaludis]|uniref:Large polyvalent protein associated domain-containing protein n=1 Tax=Methanococcus maripaludis TaxID=39152 RepID=A0A7J9NVJ4_METMI|nr:LPD28 domain-containing protein [Methanococcus maripaludis]MBA2851702.1 hypothetical protein [Methanococcus maripaludis]
MRIITTSHKRLRDDDVREGYLYHIRGEDDNGEPYSVEKHVWVNHCYSVVLSEPIDFGDDNYMTLGMFAETYGIDLLQVV